LHRFVLDDALREEAMKEIHSRAGAFLLVAFAALTAGCKKNAAPAAASNEPRLQDTYGFAARTPQDADGLVEFYHLGQAWKDFQKSPSMVALFTNPLVQHAIAQFTGGLAMSGSGSWKSFSSNPDAVKWRAIAADALGHEFSVTFSKGSADRLIAWRELSDELRFQQFLAGLKTGMAGKAGAVSTPDQFGSLLPGLATNLKALDLPPIVFSFKMGAQRTALELELKRAEAQLPANVDKSDLQISGSAFRSLIFAADKLIPPAQQAQLKQKLQQTTDPKTAEELNAWILSRRAEVVYGFVDDYWIVAIGPDHEHLKFAASITDSVLTAPEMAERCKEFSSQPLLSLSWASSRMTAASVQRIQIAPWVERARGELAQAMSQTDLQKLQADAQRIDAKALRFLPHDFSPLASFAYRKDGVRVETFGGVKPVGVPPTKPLQFSGVPSGSTLLWMDQQMDPAISQACFDWLEDIVSTAYDYAQRDVLPKLPDQQKPAVGLVINLAVPKIVELYHITKDQFVKSLGSEKAFALDLNGALPPVPQIPTPIQQSGKMPRAAYLSSIEDRALLGKSWSSYFKFAQDLALMVPMAPAQFRQGLPQPNGKTSGAITTYWYPLPMDTGDLLPNVSLWKDKVFIASTSPLFSEEIGKSLEKGAADQEINTLDLRLQLSALWDFGDKWITVAAQNPDLFFGSDAAKRDQFLQSKSDLARLVHSLRAFGGVEARIFEEKGTPRSTVIFPFKESANP
jgi:hypothetical protein